MGVVRSIGRGVHALTVGLLGLADLTGTDGRASFSKLVVVTVLAAVIARDELTWAMAALLVSASFGRSMLLAFLNRASVTTSVSESRSKAVSDSRVEQVIRQVAERRTADDAHPGLITEDTE